MEELEKMQDERLAPTPPPLEDVAHDVGGIIDYQGIIREAKYDMYDQESAVAIHQTAEASISAGELISAGKISELAPDANFVGNISLQKKLESGEITQAELVKAKEILSECYVETSKGAAMRCGDGRGEQGTKEMSAVQLISRPLGPQAMGAAQTHAIAYRMTAEPSVEANLESDLVDSRASIVETGYEIALHTDDQQHEHGKTGCGAVNGTESGIAAYNSNADLGATQLAKAVVGENYDDAAHEEHKAKAEQIPSTYIVDNAALTEKMSDIGPDSKQVYAESHEEVFAVVNNVAGTTLNRELFIHRCTKEIGKVIHVFNIDAWHFSDVAQKRYPDNATKQTEYVTAVADWQARPALNLTDGSLEVIVRAPK